MELAAKEEEIACMRANREVEAEQVQLLESELKQSKEKHAIEAGESHHLRIINTELEGELESKMLVL